MEIIAYLDRVLQNRGEEVQAWLAERAREVPPYLYGSVDLRHSGSKIAPVDTNLFPGGFNNLTPPAAARASVAAAAYLQRNFSQAKRLLLIPENHTRNLAYLENVACLRDILASAGYEVVVGTLLPEQEETLVLTTSSGRELREEPLQRVNDRLVTQDGFDADLIINNNDFTPGVPAKLKGLSQPVIPPPDMGWHRRRKRVHFAAYDALVRDFGDAFDIDHWLISAYHRNCGMVDFRAREGMQCVATNVELVLDILRVKYAEYDIKEEPYVFIKADSGTYGMGVMTARSGEEVMAMNKKFRQKMDVIKEGYHNTEVVIQEGVPSVDVIDGHTAEPMIYVVDQQAVGGAYRVNDQRDAYGNLNAPGMRFHPLCSETPEGGAAMNVPKASFGVYALIARLATLATAREEY